MQVRKAPGTSFYHHHHHLPPLHSLTIGFKWIHLFSTLSRRMWPYNRNASRSASGGDSYGDATQGVNPGLGGFQLEGSGGHAVSTNDYANEQFFDTLSGAAGGQVNSQSHNNQGGSYPDQQYTDVGPYNMFPQEPGYYQVASPAQPPFNPSTGQSQAVQPPFVSPQPQNPYASFHLQPDAYSTGEKQPGAVCNNIFSVQKYC
jgi:hypothetical protein